MLTIYNSLTRQKEVFKPIAPPKVTMYVCGMTVYDHCHLGHARMMTCFDVIVRYLKASGYDVQYVRNITDIDDKIIDRANQNNEAFDELTARFIQFLKEDEQALNLLEPDKIPRATQYIPQMVRFIEKLLTAKLAYVGANGDVFYDITQFKDYGKLSHKDIEGQESGARVQVVEAKRHPLDFVLWKKAKPDEPAWDSPWGPGRPGWHIECSVMCGECLGETIDIHGGGFDLQFPHHENEIAQSEGLTHKPLANYWMHVGFLQVNREKMSKSLGNFFTVSEVLAQYHPETVRYFLLSSHYRSQLNYSTESLAQAQQALERFYHALWGINVREVSETEPAFITWKTKFNEAMNDDFNTPQALSVLFELTHEINRLRTQNQNKEVILQASILKYFMQLLGLHQQSPEAFLKAGISEEERLKIEAVIAERSTARSEKNWEKADKLRAALNDLGVEVADTVDGTTTWRKAQTCLLP